MVPGNCHSVTQFTKNQKNAELTRCIVNGIFKSGDCLGTLNVEIILIRTPHNAGGTTTKIDGTSKQDRRIVSRRIS